MEVAFNTGLTVFTSDGLPISVAELSMKDKMVYLAREETFPRW